MRHKYRPVPFLHMRNSYLGMLDERRQTLSGALARLQPMVPPLAELTLMKAQAESLAQDLAARLTHLHTALAAHEHAVERLEQAIADIDEHTPPHPKNPDPFAAPRPPVDEARAHLVRDLREEELAWLRVRGDAQESIAEKLGEYAQLLATITIATGTRVPCPSLADLLAFLDRPASTLTLIPFATEIVQHRLRRTP